MGPPPVCGVVSAPYNFDYKMAVHQENAQARRRRRVACPSATEPTMKNSSKTGHRLAARVQDSARLKAQTSSKAAGSGRLGRPLSVKRRRAILETATALFLEHGYGNVSLDGIVRKIGGSKTTIYTHFGNKDGLFAAIVDETLNTVAAALLTVDLSKLELDEALLRVATTHLRAVLSQPYIRLIRLVAAEMPRFPELGRTFHEHGPGQSYDRFSVFLAAQIRLERLRIADIQAATDMFFGRLLHRRVLERIYGVAVPPSRKEIDSIAKSVVRDFLAIYGPNPAPT